jgi:hypothetical protein
MSIRNLAALAAISAAMLVGGGTAAAHPSAGRSIAHTAATACKQGYYRNVSGHCLHRPASNPAGSTARCPDGTYSYSEHASGTCSYHGGVGRWIHHP